MMEGTALSTREQAGYAFGMLGWSVMTNIITVMLIYFYVPPNNAALNPLIPQIAFFGIFTLLSVIAAAGRLIDAITDPIVAFLSDRSHHPGGRRLPFMRLAIFPSILFCLLIFMPLVNGESYKNVWWLLAMQTGFYLSITIYIIPYNALLPELAAGSRAKVILSTWLSLAFVMGIILSSQTPALADWVQHNLGVVARHRAFQAAIGGLCLLSGLFMAIPLLVIDEAKHMSSQPATVPIGLALRQTLSNPNFRIFILADFSYFVSLTIISSGMLYVVRVLLGLEEAIGGQVMGTMVVVSLVFYPLVIRMTDRYGKRPLVIFALLALATLLPAIFFMGKMPFSPKLQIFGFAVLAAVPTAFLGILPYAIIAEIAERDSERTGQQKEAMFFAVRNFTIKLGQTIGIMIFAILTLFGKDPGNDWGIRLSVLFGAALCLAAGLTFMRFRE